MIGKLKGTVDSIGEDAMLLDVGGVCYRVFLSSRALQQLTTGQAATLFIETHMREDHIHLYGFLTETEKHWFNLVCTVQGVGAKMGLSILSSFAPAELVAAISAKDVKILTRASGVGAKLAERLVTELKNKVGSLATSALEIAPSRTGKTSSASGNAISTVEQAVSALANLGYGRSDAYQVVQKLHQEDADAPLESLIRSSLQRLSK